MLNDRMPICITTRSRWDRCRTLDFLGSEVQKRFPVYFVVPSDQARQYAPLAEHYHVGLVKSPWKYLSRTRQHVIQSMKADRHPYFVLLDDDLNFSHRPKPTDWHMVPNTPEDNVEMFRCVERALAKYAHVSVSPRQGNNRMDPYEVHNTRTLRLLAYQTAAVQQCTVRTPTMSDFDITLQLLAMGYENCVLTTWAQDQPGTQTAGGCSDYRTHAMHEKVIRRMLALWPEVIATRQKENIGGGEFGTRTEVTIQWKKALNLYARRMEEIL